MDIFDMAKKYYPRLWDENRILALVNIGKLTKEQSEEIIQNKTNT